MDNNSLSYSKAQQLTGISLSKGHAYTFTAFVEDNKQLYEDMNKRLHILEASLNKNQKELESIESWVKELNGDEQEEIIMRIDWLYRLYKAKDEMASIETKERVNQIRRSILTVQTCPMKMQLLNKLDTLEQSFSEEGSTLHNTSGEHILMEKAIEEAGNVFINLGKTGREYVISIVLKQHGDKASIEIIQEKSIILEKRVKGLLELNDCEELVTQLEQLPLLSFSALNHCQKTDIAQQLITKKQWNGLATLERSIVQLSRSFAGENQLEQDEKNIINTSNSTATFTLDIEENSGKLEQALSFYTVIK